MSAGAGQSFPQSAFLQLFHHCLPLFTGCSPFPPLPPSLALTPLPEARSSHCTLLFMSLPFSLPSLFPRRPVLAEPESVLILSKLGEICKYS